MIKNVTISEPTFLAPLLYELGLGNYELKAGKWSIKVTKQRQVRSLSQNKYYWGVVLATISLETGNEVDELHEYFKSLAGLKTVTVSKTSKEIPISTKDMDTKEFTEYIERIRQFAMHNLKLSIPEPGGLTSDDIDQLHELYSNRYN